MTTKTSIGPNFKSECEIFDTFRQHCFVFQFPFKTNETISVRERQKTDSKIITIIDLFFRRISKLDDASKKEITPLIYDVNVLFSYYFRVKFPGSDAAIALSTDLLSKFILEDFNDISDSDFLKTTLEVVNMDKGEIAKEKIKVKAEIGDVSSGRWPPLLYKSSLVCVRKEPTEEKKEKKESKEVTEKKEKIK